MQPLNLLDASESVQVSSQRACSGDGEPSAEAAAAASQVLSMLAVSLEGTETHKQQALLSSFDLKGVAEFIKSGRAQRIVVMAGAGISVSAGIPDFRTPGTGLYSQLQRFNLPWPEAVFDVRYFRHDPKPFCMLAKELWPGYHKHAPTPTHHFLRLLHDKGLLLRVFTQNIDGLEHLAGVPVDKVVHAHGSFNGACCIDCHQPCSVYAVQAAVYGDEVPLCSSCGGLVKPDITFFGEALPAQFHRQRLTQLGRADLLIVMGTSLLVQPFASMIDQVSPNTPRVLINLTRAGEHKQQSADSAIISEQQPQCSPALTPTDGTAQRRLGVSSASSNSSSSDEYDEENEVDDTCSGGTVGGVTRNSGMVSPCEAGSPALTTCSSTSEAARAGQQLADTAVGGDSIEQGCNIRAPPAPPSAPEYGAGVCDASPGAARAANGDDHESVQSKRSAQGGSEPGEFAFDARVRDVLHLGDCDSAVQQLAELLGWQEELQGLIAAGDLAFTEARNCWQD